jgi:uncharacterized membrane protein
MRRRRAVVGLSLASAAAMGVIAAYQVGLVRRLPGPPLPWLNAEKVVGSKRAYSRLGTPDGVLGLCSYAATAALAAAGGRERARAHPILPVALAGKAVFDVFNALRLAWAEWAEDRAFCLYCLFATVCTLGVLPLVIPEARAAIWRGRGDRVAGSVRPGAGRQRRRYQHV